MNTKDSTWSFSIKNLGSLNEAHVDIKPLTILCGKNNTGKTWLMYSIYGFLNNDNFSKISKIEDIVQNIIDLGIYKFNVKEWIEENFHSFKKDIDDLNKNRLKSIFNADESLFKDTIFSWDIDSSVLVNNITKSNFSMNLVFGNKKETKFIAKKEIDSYEVELTLINQVPKELLLNAVSSIIYKVCNGFCSSSTNAFLIPAERNGLHLFYREISSRRTALLHHASRDSLDLGELLKDVLNSKYAKPIADYIDWLNELSSFKLKKGEKSDFHEIAEEVKKLIGGKYTIDNEGNISYKPRKERGGRDTPELDLHFSSSTVKSLFGLWFYLENQAESNNILMFDEPELNLHPSNQRAIARIIAKLVNKGLNVIISTHSDYFIREINSLIMLNFEGDKKIQTELLKKFDIQEDSLLSKDKVGAYVFKNNSLEEMDINYEGIIATTFDEEINLLNESSDEIFYSYITPIIENNDSEL